MKKYSLCLFAILFTLLFTVQAQEETEVSFPTLTGEYPVGKVDYQLINEDRAETFTEAEDDVREIMVTVYYPATPTADDEPAPYIPEYALNSMAAATNISADILNQIHPQGYADITVAETATGYPVILFSHGGGVQSFFYTSLLEELASHGYIVASISHTYGTGVTVFLDGKVAYINEAGSYFGDASVLDVWVADAIFVLDQLTQMNESDTLLADSMDLARVGMFGHSFGGAAAAQVHYLDDRFSAGIDMDGTLFGDVTTEGLSQPFMIIYSERSAPSEQELEQMGMTREEYDAFLVTDEIAEKLVAETSTDGYRFMLQGAAHLSFVTDAWFVQPLMPQFITAEMVGTIDPQRGYEIITAYVVAFFDKHLYGLDIPLLAENNYSEMIVVE